MLGWKKRRRKIVLVRVGSVLFHTSARHSIDGSKLSTEPLDVDQTSYLINSSAAIITNST